MHIIRVQLKTRWSNGLFMIIKSPNEYLFTGRIGGKTAPIGSRTLNRQIKSWAEAIGLRDGSYGIETLRRTRALHILKHTGNMEAVRVLLGLANIGTAARYLYDTNPVDAISISRSYEFRWLKRSIG